ncbi:MAG: O-methyltransferase [bacterium]|nr:O-methyltransferase [bacterium]
MATSSTHLTEKLNQYIVENFSAEDEFLRKLVEESLSEGIPPISIAPEQTAFLQVLLRSIGAKRVLEIGSLAGYSAIAMARALPPDGELIACELDAGFAAFITRKAHEAGLGGVIRVVHGPALLSIATLKQEPRLDAVFIDADKINYLRYLELVLPMLRVGGLIIGDNALAWGHVADPDPDFEPQNVIAIREFNERMSTHPQLQSTLVPLGDGMVIGIKLRD